MVDCLIVGAGVVGLSLAYELARHGMRLRVIDQGLPGNEASWAGAGILPPANRETAVHPLAQLCGLSQELHPQWAESLRDETGIDTGFRRCGGIYLACSAGEAASLHGLAATVREEAIAIERLDDVQIRQIEPALGPLVERGRCKAAYHLPDESQLRNPDHLAALATACRKRGVEISENIQLTGFRRAKHRIVAVETTAGEISAERYCITSGVWTRMLLDQLGLPNGIMPIRGQMVLYRCPQRPFSHVLNVGPRYLVPRDDGRVLAGSTEEEVGFDKRTTDDEIAGLMSFAAGIVDELSPANVERCWAGLRPGSFDGFPYIGAVPGLANTYVAAGHFRSGLFLSPATAVVVGQLVRGRQPEIDLSPFHVGRG